MLRQNSQRRMKRSFDEKTLLIEAIKKVGVLWNSANQLDEGLRTLLTGLTQIAYEASKIKKDVDMISIKSFGFELDDEVEKMIENLSEINDVSKVSYQHIKKAETAIEDLYDVIREAKEIGQSLQSKL